MNVCVLNPKKNHISRITWPTELKLCEQVKEKRPFLLHNSRENWLTD